MQGFFQFCLAYTADSSSSFEVVVLYARAGLDQPFFSIVINVDQSMHGVWCLKGGALKKNMICSLFCSPAVGSWIWHHSPLEEC